MDEAGIGQIPRAMPLHWLTRAYQIKARTRAANEAYWLYLSTMLRLLSSTALSETKCNLRTTAVEKMCFFPHGRIDPHKLFEYEPVLVFSVGLWLMSVRNRGCAQSWHLCCTVLAAPVVIHTFGGRGSPVIQALLLE